MTTFAETPASTVHDVEALTDDDLRDLLAYPDDIARPRLRANFIASIDGAVTLEGSGRKLGTPTDRRVFRRFRDVADVVLVGATTAAAKPYADMRLPVDAQAWRLARGLSATLPVAVVSGRGVIPSHLLDTPAAPPVVLVSADAEATHRRALDRAGARVVELPGRRIGSTAVRDALAASGLHRVLVEGGPTLFSQLVFDGVIDELGITTSPMLVAGPARRIAASEVHVAIAMRRRRVLLGDDGTTIVHWSRP